jgi:hypothetical protein
VECRNNPRPYFSSLWWKDICELDDCVADRSWVEEAIVKKLGNGALTSFWVDKWLGDTPLYLKFPRLYVLSTQQEARVSDLVVEIVGEGRVWNLVWRRPLFQWEEECVAFLLTSLQAVVFSQEMDKWIWSLDPDGGFFG